ncbi:MAG: ClpXP protease specificity-enhancing factor [Burkholderiaceae bacterium]|jgi:stringent starvation protein B|nr:ClpXP protease specificity-enhancing factor [Burkholderiaceae bacterium]
MSAIENPPESTSVRPYFIRAVHEWCTDNGLTPYMAVMVDESVRAPREYVRNSEIVLNLSYQATHALKIGNEFIEFKARFGGMLRDIVVPVERVAAIYARENGQGMGFPVLAEGSEDGAAQDAAQAQEAIPSTPFKTGPQLPPVSVGNAPDDGEPPPHKNRPPAFKRVK